MDNLKKLLSCFFVLPVESTSSKYNEELHVQLYKGRYRLTTKQAIYSFEDKYDNFRGAFQIINWDRYHPEKILVLGLGLGSVIQILENIFKLKATYTCIEIDEKVAYLANKYILKNLNSLIEIIIADARMFMESNEQKYDMILMDIFQDAVVPPYFETTDFLYQIKSALSPDGLLIYNRLAYTKRDQEKSRLFFSDAFMKVFKKSTLKFIHNNFMLFNHSKYIDRRYLEEERIVL